MNTTNVLIGTTVLTAAAVALLMNVNKNKGTPPVTETNNTNAARVMSGQAGARFNNNPTTTEDRLFMGVVATGNISSPQMGGANFGAANKYNSGVRNVPNSTNGQGGIGMVMPDPFSPHDDVHARALVNYTND